MSDSQGLRIGEIQWKELPFGNKRNLQESARIVATFGERSLFEMEQNLESRKANKLHRIPGREVKIEKSGVSPFHYEVD